MQHAKHTAAPVRVRLTDRAGRVLGFLFLPPTVRLAELEGTLRTIGAAHLEVLQ